jgi:hypothetical protein
VVSVSHCSPHSLWHLLWWVGTAAGPRCVYTPNHTPGPAAFQLLAPPQSWQ